MPPSSRVVSSFEGVFLPSHEDGLRPSEPRTTPDGRGPHDDERAPPDQEELCTCREERCRHPSMRCRRSTEHSSRGTRTSFGRHKSAQRATDAVLPTTNELLPTRRTFAHAGRSDVVVLPCGVVVRRSIPLVARRRPSAVVRAHNASCGFGQRQTTNRCATDERALASDMGSGHARDAHKSRRRPRFALLHDMPPARRLRDEWA